MMPDTEIFLVFTILIFAVTMFLTGWLRMDIVGLSVLALLALFGLISPEEAISGFSNPAVIVVWAMFILSASIYHTGVTRMIGRQVLKLSGTQEWRIILAIMITSGLLSTIMSNIGVTALMLPVVMDIARRTGRSPSRLLIPQAFATHLGGLTTLIGTPANLLVSYQL
ncbi:MAG: SLC13 family permease, partial [Bacteroidota bacterium]